VFFRLKGKGDGSYKKKCPKPKLNNKIPRKNPKDEKKDDFKKSFC
jgi:hypothetical protein